MKRTNNLLIFNSFSLKRRYKNWAVPWWLNASLKWSFNHTWFSRFDNIILNFYASNALFDKYIKVLDVKHCVALFSIIIIVTSSLHQWIKNQIRSKSDMCLKKRNWQVALFWNYTKRLHTVFCINMLRLFVPVKIISN